MSKKAQQDSAPKPRRISIRRTISCFKKSNYN